MIYTRHERGLSRAIGYEVRGEGPAVLLLHPFPFDRRFWSTLHLPDFRVVALDARGFGDSQLGEPGYGIDDLADDAVALLDHLGIAMAAAVGSSMGGYVALSLAERHPARLSSLVLIGTRAGADSETALANRQASIVEIRAHGAGEFLGGVATRMCGRTSSPSVRAEVQALALDSSNDFVHALPATQNALGSRSDRSHVLPGLRLPALVIVGQEDAVTPLDEARAMHAALAGSELVVFPACGHLPSIEHAEAFEALLGRFLRDELLHD